VGRGDLRDRPAGHDRAVMGDWWPAWAVVILSFVVFLPWVLAAVS
jgi:hypothetical protein